MIPPTAPHAPPRQLLRSRDHRLIAGVAGGAGEYLGIDPVIVRIALVVLTLAGGFGVLLYLAAWLIVPEADPDAAVAGPVDERDRTHTWLAVGALAVVVVLGGAGGIGWGLGFHGGFVWPLAVIAIGALVLWNRSERADVAVAGESEPGESETGGSETGVTSGPHSTGTIPTTPASPTAPIAAPVRRRPSILRRAVPVIGRAILVVLIGTVTLIATTFAVAALEGADVLDVSAFEAAVIGAVALGLAIWLGIVVHRVPELVACAIAISMVFAFAAWLRPPLRGGYGTRNFRPENAAAVRHSYALAGGRLHLDLSDVTLSRTTDISVQLGGGLLQVVAPPDTTVVVDGHVGAGVLCTFGRRDTGLGITRTVTSAGGTKILRLEPRVGAGAIVIGRTALEVERACP